MKNKIKYLFLLILSISIMLVGGCSSKEKSDENNYVSVDDAELIVKEKLSPNKEYVETEDDIVYYIVEIYQNDDKEIIINADSNSGFFDKMQYIIDSDVKITRENTNILWTTLMGNQEYSKEDQLAVAQITIYNNDEIISQRKINFVSKGIEIIVDSIDK